LSEVWLEVEQEYHFLITSSEVLRFQQAFDCYAHPFRNIEKFSALSKNLHVFKIFGFF